IQQMIKKALLLVFTLISVGAGAQQLNSYGLAVVSSIEDYKKSVSENADKQLVELSTYIPDIKLDIRYATTNNFAGQAVYKEARAFARLPVARALKKVQEELQKMSLGLKIYDAYRPYTVTVKFFQVESEENIVAKPKSGSKHSRGCAVGLTLMDLKTGRELTMPTDYDSFEAAASPTFNDLPAGIVKNRDLLIRVMQSQG